MATQLSTFTVKLYYRERTGANAIGPRVDARVGAEEIAALYRRGNRERIEVRGHDGRALSAGQYQGFLNMVEQIIEEDGHGNS